MYRRRSRKKTKGRPSGTTSLRLRSWKLEKTLARGENITEFKKFFTPQIKDIKKRVQGGSYYGTVIWPHTSLGIVLRLFKYISYVKHVVNKIVPNVEDFKELCSFRGDKYEAFLLMYSKSNLTKQDMKELCDHYYLKSNFKLLKLVHQFGFRCTNKNPLEKVPITQINFFKRCGYSSDKKVVEKILTKCNNLGIFCTMFTKSELKGIKLGLVSSRKIIKIYCFSDIKSLLNSQVQFHKRCLESITNINFHSMIFLHQFGYQLPATVRLNEIVPYKSLFEKYRWYYHRTSKKIPRRSVQRDNLAISKARYLQEEGVKLINNIHTETLQDLYFNGYFQFIKYLLTEHPSNLLTPSRGYFLRYLLTEGRYKDIPELVKLGLVSGNALVSGNIPLNKNSKVFNKAMVYLYKHFRWTVPKYIISSLCQSIEGLETMELLDVPFSEINWRSFCRNATVKKIKWLEGRGVAIPKKCLKHLVNSTRIAAITYLKKYNWKVNSSIMAKLNTGYSYYSYRQKRYKQQTKDMFDLLVSQYNIKVDQKLVEWFAKYSRTYMIIHIIRKYKVFPSEADILSICSSGGRTYYSRMDNNINTIIKWVVSGKIPFKVTKDNQTQLIRIITETGKKDLIAEGLKLIKGFAKTPLKAAIADQNQYKHNYYNRKSSCQNFMAMMDAGLIDESDTSNLITSIFRDNSLPYDLTYYLLNRYKDKITMTQLEFNRLVLDCYVDSEIRYQLEKLFGVKNTPYTVKLAVLNVLKNTRNSYFYLGRGVLHKKDTLCRDIIPILKLAKESGVTFPTERGMIRRYKRERKFREAKEQPVEKQIEDMFNRHKIKIVDYVPTKDEIVPDLDNIILNYMAIVRGNNRMYDIVSSEEINGPDDKDEFLKEVEKEEKLGNILLDADVKSVETK